VGSILILIKVVSHSRYLFFLFSLLFLIFDLEVLLLYPYVVSSYNNGIYGLTIFLIFLLVLTFGFVFEIGKGALKINSRQTTNLQNYKIKGLTSPSFLAYYSILAEKKKLTIKYTS